MQGLSTYLLAKFKGLGCLQMSGTVGDISSLGRYVFGSEISYNKPPPRLPGLGC